MTSPDYKQILLGAYDVAVAVSRPENGMTPYIPAKPKGKTYIIGAGKAAARMAQVFEELWDHDMEGMVITRYGHKLPTKIIRVIEAAHPVPDQAGMDGAKDMLAFLEQTTADDLVVCLLSGGGSALLTCPADGIDFADIQTLNKQLLACGAGIHEINTVRKHLNQAFGGKLAKAAAPARLVTLSISDVAGDDPSTIASGPTVGDPTTLEDARAILKKYDIQTTQAIVDYLNDPAHETPKPDDPVFANTEYHLIATPQKALEAAAAYIQERGFTPYILSSEIEGDTNEAAGFHVALVKQVLRHNQPVKRPCALISGGETTVKLTGTGDGGPNTQLMLASALLLNRADGVYALSCDTDGIDGNKDNAGATIDSTTMKRAEAAGLNAKALLTNNDSYAFFDALADRVAPGPTHTNVNDFRIFLIL
ncbi:MAG: glycerate kinase [Rhodospirillales bacterium]|nr:glycerate kinase [Rhodospirillales bacterium]